MKVAAGECIARRPFSGAAELRIVQISRTK
jgi:hypothetical protein